MAGTEQRTVVDLSIYRFRHPSRKKFVRNFERASVVAGALLLTGGVYDGWVNTSPITLAIEEEVRKTHPEPTIEEQNAAKEILNAYKQRVATLNQGEEFGEIHDATAPGNMTAVFEARNVQEQAAKYRQELAKQLNKVHGKAPFDRSAVDLMTAVAGSLILGVNWLRRPGKSFG